MSEGGESSERLRGGGGRVRDGRVRVEENLTGLCIHDGAPRDVAAFCCRVPEAVAGTDAVAGSSVDAVGAAAGVGPADEHPALTRATVATSTALALTIGTDVRCMDVPSWLPL